VIQKWTLWAPSVCADWWCCGRCRAESFAHSGDALAGVGEDLDEEHADQEGFDVGDPDLGPSAGLLRQGNGTVAAAPKTQPGNRVVSLTPPPYGRRRQSQESIK